MRKAQAEHLIAVLEEIRDLLRPAPEPAAPPEDIFACPHPDEARIDLTSMGEPEWECRACGFHFVGNKGV